MPLDEFRERAPALPVEEATLNIGVFPAGFPQPVSIGFVVYSGFSPTDDEPWSTLTVSGNDEIAVNGVFVAARERVEKLYEKQRRAEALAAEKAEADARRKEAEAPASLWRRVRDNPWTVSIVSSVITSTLFFLLGLYIGSQ